MVCKSRYVLPVLVFSLLAVRTTPVLSSLHPSSEQFLSYCTVTTGDVNGDAFFARCENYIHETRLILDQGDVHGIRACIPAQISDLKLVMTAIEWMEENPSADHMESDEALARAFSEKWSCP